MRLRPRTALLALLLLLLVGTTVPLDARQFTAQIQMALQTLGIWPYDGSYVAGDVPVWSVTSNKFLPSTAAGGGVISATRFLAGDGTAAAPSYSFTSETDLGFWRYSANTLGFTTNGTAAGFIFQQNIGQFGSAGTLQWTSTTDAGGAGGDLILAREGAGHLFQRVTTNAQRLSVANTYTSATNYEAFSVDWQTTANNAIVGTRTAATGTTRILTLAAQGSNAGTLSALDLQAGAPFVRQGHRTVGGTWAQSTGSTGNFSQWADFTSTASSGTVVAFAIVPTYNQTGTAAGTDLLINRTQTAVGSGQQLFFRLAIADVTKHYVTADGTARGVQEAFVQATALTCTAANSCGTGNGTFATGSSDTAGSVTLGTTPASGFIIGFGGTWVAAPVCTVWMNKAGMVVGKTVLTSVTTTTQITVVTNGTAPATGDIYAYRCTGIQ